MHRLRKQRLPSWTPRAARRRRSRGSRRESPTTPQGKTGFAVSCENPMGCSFPRSYQATGGPTRPHRNRGANRRENRDGPIAVGQSRAQISAPVSLSSREVAPRTLAVRNGEAPWIQDRTPATCARSARADREHADSPGSRTPCAGLGRGRVERYGSVAAFAARERAGCENETLCNVASCAPPWPTCRVVPWPRWRLPVVSDWSAPRGRPDAETVDAERCRCRPRYIRKAVVEVRRASDADDLVQVSMRVG